jgi:hypothetical protein
VDFLKDMYNLIIYNLPKNLTIDLQNQLNNIVSIKFVYKEDDIVFVLNNDFISYETFCDIKNIINSFSNKHNLNIDFKL